MEEKADAQTLTEKGILYCPDYVINAGGLIDVYYEKIGYKPEKAEQQLENIYTTLGEIFQAAKEQNITTNQAAFELAQKRIATAKESLKVKIGA